MTDRQVEFHAFYHDLRIVDQKNFYSARSDEYRAAHRQAIMRATCCCSRRRSPASSMS